MPALLRLGEAHVDENLEEAAPDVPDELRYLLLRGEQVRHGTALSVLEEERSVARLQARGDRIELGREHWLTSGVDNRSLPA
jgi:hypothetical protein